MSSTSSGTGLSSESAMSARASCRLRETAMFAMFTPASPRMFPSRPIIPGVSSFTAKSMKRSTFTSIS